MPDVHDAPAYRAFLLDPAGKVYAAIDLIEAKDDDEARELGRKHVDGCGVEVWERTRVVARFPSDQVDGL